MAALATAAVRHRLPSTGLAVVNVKLVTNETITLLTTTSSSTLLPMVTPTTTIAGTHRLTAISIPTITLSATPSAQPLKVQTTTTTTLHVNVVSTDTTTPTLVHVLAHVAVLVHVGVPVTVAQAVALVVGGVVNSRKQRRRLSTRRTQRYTSVGARRFRCGPSSRLRSCSSVALRLPSLTSTRWRSSCNSRSILGPLSGFRIDRNGLSRQDCSSNIFRVCMLRVCKPPNIRLLSSRRRGPRPLQKHTSKSVAS